MEANNATGGRGSSIIECTSVATMERNLLELEVAVLVSGLVLAAMVLYGITRSPDSDRVLRTVIWGAYSLSYGMVAYAVGLVQERSFFHSDTFSLWVTALLLLQASAYAAPSRDMDQLKTRLLHHVLQTGLVLWLLVTGIGHNASYRAATWAFWSLNVFKTAVKIVEVFKARPLRPSAEVVAEYMAAEESLAAAADQMPNPKTMTGYKYLFHGEETIQLMSGTHDEIRTMMSSASAKEVVTIDQVYRWIDAQGSSAIEKDMAKDMCLAFSLFKLLKRRFYGYIPAEAGSPKSLNLVLSGLIYQGQAVLVSDAAFRVVEAELAFLYDFFYTRNIVLTGARTHIFTAVVVLGLSMWATFFGTLGPGYSAMVIGVKNLARAVTVVIVLIIAALELCQALLRLFDHWKYIETVYHCVRDNRPWSKRPRRQFWSQYSLMPPEYWVGEQKIGQYVFLHSYNHRPWNVLSWLTLEIVKPLRLGQKRGRRKGLPTQVRRAVLISLKDSGGKLTNGVATLQRHGLSRQLAWACVFPKVTDQVLVWHVVTTRFDWMSRGDGTDEPGGDNHRLVARRLSNYCAYLVAFVPEMLPDPTYNAQKMFDMAVQQARKHLAGCRTTPDILDKLEEIQRKEESYQDLYVRAATGSSSIIEKAVLLGRQLMASVPDEGRRWKVLAEFWAEFILFLAPSDNVDIHADMLGAGGEFMTQLWALLNNAGILERPAVATSSPWRTWSDS